MSEASPNDKNIAVLTHLGGIFFGFIPALVVCCSRRMTTLSSANRRARR
jgi:hypothetical protein